MKNWLVVVLISCGLFAAAIFQYKTILSGYAEFFTVNNVTSGADAIVVLSGGKGTRIPHALKLFAEGFAPRLLLTEEKKRNHLLYRLLLHLSPPPCTAKVGGGLNF